MSRGVCVSMTLQFNLLSAMVSLACFLQLHPVNVTFDWFNGMDHEVKRENPYIATSSGAIAAGQLEIGSRIQCSTPSGCHEVFFVVGLQWSRKSTAFPMALLL